MKKVFYDRHKKRFRKIMRRRRLAKHRWRVGLSEYTKSRVAHRNGGQMAKVERTIPRWMAGPR